MTQLTTAQIDAFAAAVDEAGYGCEPEQVVTTLDTLADFTRQWGRADEQDERDGVVLHIWYKVQARPGTPRKTLIVADMGEARATYF